MRLSSTRLETMLGLNLRKKPARIGIALGGGGVRGLAAVPILKMLDDLGVEVTHVAGTSMGAILGALYALGLSGEEIESRVRDHIVLKGEGIRSVYQKRKYLLKWLRVFGVTTERGGILSADGAFKHLFKEISEKEFSDCKRKFTAVATDYWTGEEVVLTEGALLPAVKASMALPGIFHSIKMDDYLLLDGGLVNNVPYDKIQGEVDFCIAVDVMEPPHAEGDKAPSAYETLLGAVDILQVNALKLRLEITRPDILVEPDIDQVRILDFPKIEYVLKRGEVAAQNLREQIEQEYSWLLPSSREAE